METERGEGAHRNKREKKWDRDQRDRVVANLAARDGNRCWYCGCAFGEGGEPMTIDHVHPLGRGGRSLQTNLRLACVTCNRHKAGQSVNDFLASEFLRQRRSRFEATDDGSDDLADLA